MKHIFNSLGSNYTLPFSLQALMYLIQLPPRQKIVAKLESACKKLFPAFENGPYFFYKGRDAIEFVLKSHSIGDGDLVLTQAFTCHAIEAAIRRTGAQPVFVDLEENSLHPSVKTISAVYKQHPQVKALIIQHTLGFAAPITKIRKWCTENNILLIEDLAQAFGGVDESGALLGSTADAIILSFGRDKIIDAVSGGVCFIRKYSAHTHTENFRSLTYKVFCTDLWYPFLTYCIRKTYPIYLGKIILFVAKTMGLIVSPVKARFEFSTALPASVAALSLTYFETLPEQLAHRRKIAEIYQAALHRQVV
jgi:dTDP-4-amino-4,6-dideoxygalactose transaminase